LRLPKYQGYQGQSPWLVREQRRARIVVCDDDVDVCSLVGTLLRELGHTVSEAPNPILALQILERERPLDLLLVDYAMPEMNGQDVIDRARRYQPSLKMLLMTGYAEASHNNGMSGIPILPKPFKAAELSRRNARMLQHCLSKQTHCQCDCRPLECQLRTSAFRKGLSVNEQIIENGSEAGYQVRARPLQDCVRVISRGYYMHAPR